MNKTAFIVMSTKCNENCPYCFYKQDYFKKKYNKISSQKFDVLIDKLKELKVSEVILTGGEPLLMLKSLCKLLLKLNKYRFNVGLNTNGTLLTIESLKKMKELGLKQIFLSSRYWYKLKPNIIHCLENLFTLTVIHVISKKNILDTENIIEEIKKHNIKLIIQPAYIPEDFSAYERLSPKRMNYKLRKKLVEYIEQLSSTPSEIYISSLRSIFCKEKNKKTSLACHMGKSDLVIYPNGTVFPCFHRQDLIVGNIFDDKSHYIKKKLEYFSKFTIDAKCFGEHCVSLFY